MLLGGEFLELAFSVTILIACISYMFLGCAGHKRRSGEESQTAEPTPDDQQAGSQLDQAEGSRAPEGASKLSNADQSIAGYQSQTSEILAGPGDNQVDGGSTLSRHSHSGASQIGARSSHVGSTLSSHHQSSHAASRHGSSIAGHSSSAMQSSKFGSTLDSALASRAAGGGPASILSVVSRAGASNIQSSLSSTPSVHSSARASNLGASNIGSGVTSNLQSSSMNSNLDSHLQRSRASNIAQSIISKAGKSRHSAIANQTASSTRSQPVSSSKSTSRVLSSSVAVSGSSPVSGQSVVSSHTSGAATPRSESGSPMSGRSVNTPQSSSSRVSAKSK